MASSGLLAREPKTRKGRKVLEAKAPKIIENVKSAMFIKTPSTSQFMADVMKDFVRKSISFEMLFASHVNVTDTNLR